LHTKHEGNHYQIEADVYQLISSPWSAYTLLMTHFKTKLKSNSSNTSPCFKQFLQETCRHIFVYLDAAISFI